VDEVVRVDPGARHGIRIIHTLSGDYGSAGDGEGCGRSARGQLEEPCRIRAAATTKTAYEITVIVDPIDRGVTTAAHVIGGIGTIVQQESMVVDHTFGVLIENTDDIPGIVDAICGRVDHIVGGVDDGCEGVAGWRATGHGLKACSFTELCVVAEPDAVATLVDVSNGRVFVIRFVDLLIILEFFLGFGIG
jgi:hypothetical protein